MIQFRSSYICRLLLIFIISNAKCQGNVCPESCAAVYQPVCGSDGRTYGNACSLTLASEPCKQGSVVYRACDGKCPCSDCSNSEIRQTPVCGEDGIIYKTACSASRAGIKFSVPLTDAVAAIGGTCNLKDFLKTLLSALGRV